MNLSPGAMREIHWHTNNDELQYYIQGEARMTVLEPGPKARAFNYRAGDVEYVPVGNFHYVQNIGKESGLAIETICESCRKYRTNIRICSVLSFLFLV